MEAQLSASTIAPGSVFVKRPSPGVERRPSASSVFHAALSDARRPVTVTIGLAIFQALAAGPTVVNLSALAREQGVSRRTAGRALAHLEVRGRILRLPDYATGKRPGRPAKYALAPRIAKSLKDATSAKRGPRTEDEVQRLEKKPPTARHLPKGENDLAKILTETKKRRQETAQLTKWLPKADGNRLPSHQEKRKLSAAIRRKVEKPLADSLPNVLWWRNSLPLSVWRDATGAIWNGCYPDTEDERELGFRSRKAVSVLAKTGNRSAFRQILEQGATDAERKLRIAQARLRGLERWQREGGRSDDEDGYENDGPDRGDRLSWFVEKRAQLEREIYEARGEDGGGALGEVLGAMQGAPVKVHGEEALESALVRAERARSAGTVYGERGRVFLRRIAESGAEPLPIAASILGPHSPARPRQTADERQARWAQWQEDHPEDDAQDDGVPK